MLGLSKAFDTLNHVLLIGNLIVYGFQYDKLKLIRSCLTSRWHRTNINTAFGAWEQSTQGVPQGSVLGFLLFNIYLNNLFYLSECEKVCTFADDTTF